ncbi:Rv3235 family protein [Antribacter gilvus]|uniref:Rv3235 family protein n=1 Tax=Antribacter gilvus TaxID=2304675 RepID=UPI001F0BB851|nr:Rv3235 family protein [Antribacter gilvus]
MTATADAMPLTTALPAATAATAPARALRTQPVPGPSPRPTPRPAPRPGEAVQPGRAAGVGQRVRKVQLGGTQRPGLREAEAVLKSLEGRPTPDEAPPLPDPTQLVCRVVRAAVEVLRGDRPAAQLARWVTPQVYDQLLERGRLMRKVLPPGSAGHPATVRRVRLELVEGGTAAEATVILQDAGRVRAAAVRLEAHRGAWRVACLEIG